MSNQIPENTEYVEALAGYLRCSTSEQKINGLSIEAQRHLLESYCEKNQNKCRIVKWYIDEGVSGTKLIAKRPALRQMAEDAQKGLFSRIVFIKLDRFFRSVPEYHEYMKLISPVTWTATEEKYDLTSANGRAFVQMKLTIAELEAATTGERITLVNEYKVKSGMPLQGTRCMPFCFAVESRDGEKAKYIVKRNEEAMKELLAHVFLNKSIRGAMTYINKKFGLRLRYQAVQNVLTNEMICGSYRGNPNYCPPYISRADFERLQVLIERSPRTSDNEHTYIFSGLLKCPQCGRMLNGGLHVTTRGDKQYRYYNYRCPNHRASHLCDFKMAIFENTLEKLMLSEIEGFIGKKKAKIESIKAKGERISKYDVNELQAELDRLNYSWQKGRIKSVEEYDKKYDDLVAKIEKATNEQAALDALPDYEKIQQVLTAGWKDIYKKLDGEHKRAFWREFIKEIHIEWTPYKKEIKNIDFF